MSSTLTKKLLFSNNSKPMLFSLRTFSTSCKAVRIEKFGLENAKIGSITLPSVGSNQILVKMLAAPINPSDVNVLEGTYGATPSLPFVAGREGVGIVQQVGSSVSGVKVNDWVIGVPKPNSTFNTWSEMSVVNAEDADVVPNDIPAEYAAALAVNPTTALRLLEDFAALKSGDTIVQNAANSLVGLSVIQLARARGIKTINFIRQRHDMPNMINRLKLLGADVVLPSSIPRHLIKELCSGVPAPKLALNATSDETVGEMMRLVADDAHFVTYGAMARKPLSFSSSNLIFKNIKVQGFWMSKWYASHSKQEREAMYGTLIPMIRSKKLTLFFERHPFEHFENALDVAIRPQKDRKVILRFDDPKTWPESV